MTVIGWVSHIYDIKYQKLKLRTVSSRVPSDSVGVKTFFVFQSLAISKLVEAFGHRLDQEETFEIRFLAWR